MNITRLPLSESVDGRMIKIIQTGSPGDSLHVAHATAIDEIWLWAVNTDPAARKLSVQFGGTASPDDLIEFTVEPESGLYLIVPGLILSNSLIVRAFAAAANLVMIGGYINRIAQ